MTYTKNTGRSYTQSWLSKGFTLIELLVVVLIIGILAAVAVPQYQKAVLKSRLSEQAINLKALDRAQQVYYLDNGEFTTNVGNLDTQVKVGFCGDYVSTINCEMPRIIQGVVLAWQGAQQGGNTQLQCFADKDNSEANKICQSYKKDFGGNWPSSTVGNQIKYILNPLYL